MEKIHVIFKTHLDIGFTDLASVVLEQYRQEFIPKALELAETIPESFIWTTGSWLIAYYLKHPDVPLVDKQRMEKSIRSGQINWHGLPVTTHTELMDQTLFEYGLSISEELDQVYGKKTIAAKMTDVPGHSIAIVPLMAKAGLKYLHIGVNASSALPAVPEMFLWRAKDGSELIVHYAQDYGDFFKKEGWSDSLYFAHTHDNAGPPRSAEEVTQLFQTLQQEYPDAEIIPSTLDNFAKVAWEKRAELPIIEEEIGDSWIHGIASDPKKVADYLNLLDLRTKWLDQGRIHLTDQSYREFSDALLLIAEHTWGGNGNVFLPDYENYQLADFKVARKKDKITFNQEKSGLSFGEMMAQISTDTTSKELADKRSYQLYEASWDEKRTYIDLAIAALPADLQSEAKEVINRQSIASSEPLTTNQILVGKTYQVGELAFYFHSNGSFGGLEIAGRQLIQPGKEFGGLSYERFDFADYSRYLSQYSRLDKWTSTWCLVDFAKRGIEAHASIRHQVVKPVITGSSLKEIPTGVQVEFSLAFKESEQELWGVPSKLQLTYQIDVEQKKISGELKWSGKQGNRMPEAYWLETSIDVANPYRWEMHKLNQPLSPYNVVEHGNRNQHALTQEGITYLGIEGRRQIRSLDAPLFSFGRRNLLVFDDEQPSLKEGIYVNLYNNIWGTNFPAWFEEDMNYRFEFSY